MVKNGKEEILKNGQRLYGIKINVAGDNNIVKLIYPINFNNSIIDIHFTRNSYVEINSSPHIDGINISVNYGFNQKVIIGKGTTCCGLKIDAPSNSSCLIGNDCMFGEFVKCWSGDCHAITDKNTGELINADPEALHVGNHCWIGESTRLLKHTYLPDNTIVGACSVVTKPFGEENLIIAGNPAKIIKRNAVWHRNNQCAENYKNS